MTKNGRGFTFWEKMGTDLLTKLLFSSKRLIILSSEVKNVDNNVWIKL